jgi:hypothetical protein
MSEPTPPDPEKIHGAAEVDVLPRGEDPGITEPSPPNIQSRARRLMATVLMALIAASIWVLVHNLRGIWLPALTSPILRSFEPYADRVENYDPKDGLSFDSAFPPERFEFGFRKLTVNIKRTSEHPNPFGAFEIIAGLDSRDTAVEMSDREAEFSDVVQRVLEQESFEDLEKDLGKSRLKGRLMSELNRKLTQGRVKEINFKSLILRP